MKRSLGLVLLFVLSACSIEKFTYENESQTELSEIIYERKSAQGSLQAIIRSDGRGTCQGTQDGQSFFYKASFDPDTFAGAEEALEKEGYFRFTKNLDSIPRNIPYQRLSVFRDGVRVSVTHSEDRPMANAETRIFNASVNVVARLRADTNWGDETANALCKSAE